MGSNNILGGRNTVIRWVTDNVSSDGDIPRRHSGGFTGASELLSPQATKAKGDPCLQLLRSLLIDGCAGNISLIGARLRHVLLSCKMTALDLTLTACVLSSPFR